MATQVQNSSGTSVIVATIILAMVLMLIPLPEHAEFFRPEFVLMVLIYWVMALPKRIGIAVAWTVGLAMDVLYGSDLGVYAFTYAFSIFMVARFYLQLRQFPVWQQALMILALTLLAQIIPALNHLQSANWYIWLPALTSTLIWPLNYSFLRMLRRAFQVN